jgi:hypothetical protein
MGALNLILRKLNKQLAKIQALLISNKRPSAPSLSNPSLSSPPSSSPSLASSSTSPSQPSEEIPLLEQEIHQILQVAIALCQRCSQPLSSLTATSSSSKKAKSSASPHLLGGVDPDSESQGMWFLLLDAIVVPIRRLKAKKNRRAGLAALSGPDAFSAPPEPQGRSDSPGKN